MFDNLIRVNLNELHKLDAAYAGKEEFTEPDIKKFDVLTCTLSRLMKSLPYIEEFGYDRESEISGRRSRDSMGRFSSTAQGQPMSSGHYPMPAPLPPVYGEGMSRGYYSSGYDPRYWR